MIKKIIYISSLFLILFSCTDDPDIETNDSSKELIGTWKLTSKTESFYTSKHLVFSEDGKLYEFLEDNFGFREVKTSSYTIEDNLIYHRKVDMYYYEDEYLKYSVKDNTLSIEHAEEIDFSFEYYEKTNDIDISNLVISIDLPEKKFPTDIYDNIYDITWTGEKLWVTTGHNGELINVNISNGTIIEKLNPPSDSYNNLGITYGRDMLITSNSNTIFFRNPATGSRISELSFPEPKAIYDLATDGNSIFTNEYFEKTIQEYDYQGKNPITIKFNYNITDISFYNGYLWMLCGKYIYKFDHNEQKVKESYKLTNLGLDYFGDASIVFINKKLWFMDDDHSFYETEIN